LFVWFIVCVHLCDKLISFVYIKPCSRIIEINNEINWEELRKEILISQVKKALAPFNKIADKGELNIRVSWNRKGLPEIDIYPIKTMNTEEKSD